MKNNYYLLFIMLFITGSDLLSVSIKQEQTIEPMKNIRFVPKEFNGIDLGYSKTLITPCSPGYPSGDIALNSLMINVPEQIVYDIDSTDVIPILPACTADNISFRRANKYYNDDMTFHVKMMGEEKVYSGKIFDEEDDGNRVPLPPEVQEQMKKDRDQWIKEAQTYRDDELNEGQSSRVFMNLNIMNYVNIPFLPGRYEIWYSCSGLESNHCYFEIVAEK